jgi:hypothetical protein
LFGITLYWTATRTVTVTLSAVFVSVDTLICCWKREERRGGGGRVVRSRTREGDVHFAGNVR